MGRKKLVAKIEVLVRSKGYRISVPKWDKKEGPFVSWDDDPTTAWEAIKAKALAGLEESAQ